MTLIDKFVLIIDEGVAKLFIETRVAMQCLDIWQVTSSCLIDQLAGRSITRDNKVMMDVERFRELCKLAGLIGCKDRADKCLTEMNRNRAFDCITNVGPSLAVLTLADKNVVVVAVNNASDLITALSAFGDNPAVAIEYFNIPNGGCPIAAWNHLRGQPAKFKSLNGIDVDVLYFTGSLDSIQATIAGLYRPSPPPKQRCWRQMIGSLIEQTTMLLTMHTNHQQRLEDIFIELTALPADAPTQKVIMLASRVVVEIAYITLDSN